MNILPFVVFVSLISLFFTPSLLSSILPANDRQIFNYHDLRQAIIEQHKLSLNENTKGDSERKSLSYSPRLELLAQSWSQRSDDREKALPDVKFLLHSTWMVFEPSSDKQMNTQESGDIHTELISGKRNTMLTEFHLHNTTFHLTSLVSPMSFIESLGVSSSSMNDMKIGVWAHSTSFGCFMNTQKSSGQPSLTCIYDHETNNTGGKNIISMNNDIPSEKLESSSTKDNSATESPELTEELNEKMVLKVVSCERTIPSATNTMVSECVHKEIQETVSRGNPFLWFTNKDVSSDAIFVSKNFCFSLLFIFILILMI